MTDDQEEEVRMVDVGELTTQDCATLAHAFEGTSTSWFRSGLATTKPSNALSNT